MRQRVSMRLTIAAAVVIGAFVVAVPRSTAAPTIRWDRTIGDSLEGIATVDGGAVVTGNVIRDGEQHPALLVRRVDASGDVVWSRTWHPKGTRVHGST